MKAKLFFIKAITPLHVGSGSDLGVVDLPIQREAHTGFPKIEASSLKGAIRNAFENEDRDDEFKKKIQIAFGCDGCDNEFKDIFDNKNKDFAGALGFCDARILFFPVKSVKGIYAYITCPMVLERFNQDIENLETNNLEKIEIPSNIDDDKCIVFDDNVNTIKIENNEYVVLEEYSFKIEKKNSEKFIKIPNLNIDKRIVIVSDDNFAHFVKNSTEVITRIKIDNTTGVVQKGGLFTEEYLPAESILYSLAIANKPFKLNNIELFKSENDVLNFFSEIPNVIQIGGNSTLGKGIVEIIGVKNGN